MIAPKLPPIIGLRSPLLRHLMKADGIAIHVKKGTFLFQKGGIPAVYMLDKGGLILVGPTVNQIQFLARNQVIGVAECLSQSHWGYSTFAVGPVSVYKLSPRDLMKHFSTNPALRKQCLSGLIARATTFE